MDEGLEGLVAAIRNEKVFSYESREAAARAFGKARGWRVTDRWFSLSVLARRKVHNPREGWHHTPTSGHWSYRLFDHAYYFREVGRPGRAAAIVSHPYNFSCSPGDDGFSMEQAAEAVGPQIKITNFGREKSWWYPGWSTLLLFEPVEGDAT